MAGRHRRRWPHLHVGLTTKLLGDPGDDTLRLLQCVVAAVAVVFFVVGLHDLGGRRAATSAAWLLLLEPSSLFFTTILQKEALLLLAGGLAVFAAGRLWSDAPRVTIVATCTALVVAASVRPYAAGFLAAGLVLVGVHWAIVRAGRRRWVVIGSLAGLTLLALAAFVASGVSSRMLQRLQEFQALETDGSAALSLKPVDYSTLSGAVQAVPQRIADFVVRPLPWQLANNEQRLGALGTLIALAIGVWLIVGLARNRRRLRAVLPVLMLALTVALGYAVTSANAGTGFRHRLHVVFLFVGAGTVAWSRSPVADRLAAALHRWRDLLAGPRSPLARLAAAGGSVALRYAVVGLLNLGGSVFLIRRLGPEVWATYTVAFFLAAFFDQQVGTKVLGSIIGSKEPPTPKQVAAVALVSGGVGLFVLLVLLAVSGPLGATTALPGLTTCLAAAGGCALVLALRAPSAALLERDLRFVWIAVAEVLDQVTFFAVAIPVALGGHPVDGLALGLLVRAVPGASVLLCVSRPPLARPAWADMRAASAFGAPILGVAAFALIEGMMPFVALGGDDPTGLGWVNTAASLVGYAAVVMLVLQRVAFASLGDALRRTGSLVGATRQMGETATFLLVVMLAPVALAELWAPLLFGDRWEGSGTVFAAVGVGYLLMGPVAVLTGALYALGIPRRVTPVYLLMTAVYGGLLLFGILPITATGVAIAYACSRLTGVVAGVVALRSAVPPSSLVGTCVGAATGGAGLALVAWWSAGGPTGMAAVGVALLLAVAVTLGLRQGRGLLTRFGRPGTGPVPPPTVPAP